MLRIRLRRVGKKKQPMYRIVVADSRAPRDGGIVESIGYYHPLDNPSIIVLDGERVRLWLDRGAQPSDRVAKILAIEGIAELWRDFETQRSGRKGCLATERVCEMGSRTSRSDYSRLRSHFPGDATFGSSSWCSTT